MSAAFETAAAEVKALTKRPSDSEMLRLYGLFKQATVGDNNTGQPWAVQMEARAKWEAWAANKGKSKETAENDYVALANELKAKYS